MQHQISKILNTTEKTLKEKYHDEILEDKINTTMEYKQTARQHRPHTAYGTLDLYQTMTEQEQEKEIKQTKKKTKRQHPCQHVGCLHRRKHEPSKGIPHTVSKGAKCEACRCLHNAEEAATYTES